MFLLLFVRRPLQLHSLYALHQLRRLQFWFDESQQIRPQNKGPDRHIGSTQSSKSASVRLRQTAECSKTSAPKHEFGVLLVSEASKKQRCSVEHCHSQATVTAGRLLFPFEKPHGMDHRVLLRTPVTQPPSHPVYGDRPRGGAFPIGLASSIVWLAVTNVRRPPRWASHRPSGAAGHRSMGGTRLPPVVTPQDDLLGVTF
ncbi:hypothetical protein PILCRDRAFT_92204 [Piloderma croceum F 1598]|uniref:Uncharacterized protein n=1 Tax=Piloderma croceum (strain F 1598) TaxID=765440 RepID=A0A0C3ERM7_PILCF|nr:hypothetical protein PILCRDRAFT_92204 [Piloderma croceum F 1598]